MMVKLLCMAKSEHHDGKKDTADAVLELNGETKNAARSTRVADGGQIPKGFRVSVGNQNWRLAAGHGVTVIYPSGKSRMVRA
jgi:hypothetical protein